MRSLRSRVETACRVAAFAILGWLLGDSVIPSTRRSVERASTADVAARLEAWTRAPATTALHASFTTVPDGWVIDWLAALRHSNHLVTWSGSPPALMLAAEALPDPEGGVRVDVAAPSGANVIVSDGGSVVDSVRVNAWGASVLTPLAIGAITAQTAGQRAAAAPPDSARIRSVIVMGRAGWEGKFIVSALEERGWPVQARFSVAPNVDVAAASSLALDTSRVAAIVVVDTIVGAQGPLIEQFVRSGGGLVLAGSSGSLSSLRAIAPGGVGTRTRPVVRPTDTLRLGSTGFYPVASLNAGAVPLERRSDGVAVAARRVGSGRVLQVGYDDSWRWRMAGAPGSERAHREWWSRVMSSVAYVPSATAHTNASAMDAAPLAHLVGRLGPARPDASGRGSRGPIDKRILLALIMTLLIVEWGSRRLRGFR